MSNWIISFELIILIEKALLRFKIRGIWYSPLDEKNNNGIESLAPRDSLLLADVDGLLFPRDALPWAVDGLPRALESALLRGSGDPLLTSRALDRLLPSASASLWGTDSSEYGVTEVSGVGCRDTLFPLRVGVVGVIGVVGVVGVGVVGVIGSAEWMSFILLAW